MAVTECLSVCQSLWIRDSLGECYCPDIARKLTVLDCQPPTREALTPPSLLLWYRKGLGEQVRSREVYLVKSYASTCFKAAMANVAQDKRPLKDKGFMAWPLLLLTVCNIWTAWGWCREILKKPTQSDGYLLILLPIIIDAEWGKGHQ